MVTIKKIEETTCLLYGPDAILIGEITSELSLNDVRLQIAEEGVYGYYINWKDKTIMIDKYGNLDQWYNGFFDEQENQLCKLVGWHRKKSEDIKESS